jgi:hypothetical protein
MRTHCDVCGQAVGKHAYYREEERDLPDPRQSWTICGDCNDAVSRQLEQVTVRASQRLRVAIGVVAAERAAPRDDEAQATERERDQLADRRTERLLIAIFLVFFAVHALVFLLVLAVISPH